MLAENAGSVDEVDVDLDGTDEVELLELCRWAAVGLPPLETTSPTTTPTTASSAAPTAISWVRPNGIRSSRLRRGLPGSLRL